jgi:hypothetical protein
MCRMQAVCIMKSRVECNPQALEFFRSPMSTVPVAEILVFLLLRPFEQTYSHIKLDLTH